MAMFHMEGVVYITDARLKILKQLKFRISLDKSVNSWDRIANYQKPKLNIVEINLLSI